MENDEEPEQPKVEKSPKRFVGILVISVLVAGAAVTGTLLVPRLLTRPAAAAVDQNAETGDAGKGEEITDSAEVEPNNPQAFAPIVVDVKNKRGEMHHMRVGITVELSEKATKEEFERYQPRGREAAIGYLRSKTFEELTESSEFENIAKQLNEKIIRAMGERRCNRVVVTDYVAQ
jgi:flagellar basal body-associated protein FliL